MTSRERAILALQSLGGPPALVDAVERQINEAMLEERNACEATVRSVPLPDKFDPPGWRVGFAEGVQTAFDRLRARQGLGRVDSAAGGSS